MHILVIGEEDNFQECRQKFGVAHTYTREQDRTVAQSLFETSDVVFDFLNGSDNDQIEIYSDRAIPPLFLNATKKSLRKLTSAANFLADTVQFGFAGLPTFLSGDVLEVSLLHPAHQAVLTDVCQRLNTPFQVVQDRVGLVTPRVVGMVINEAFYTVEEGIATREDVDLAMKLGTNYPFGPFEWCQKIGARHIVDLLEALYEEDRNERYAISRLLKTEAGISA